MVARTKYICIGSTLFDHHTWLRSVESSLALGGTQDEYLNDLVEAHL